MIVRLNNAIKRDEILKCFKILSRFDKDRPRILLNTFKFAS